MVLLNLGNVLEKIVCVVVQLDDLGFVGRSK